MWKKQKAKALNRCKLEIYNKIIEQVMKYLDVDITNNKILLKKVKEKVVKANKTTACLKTTTWNIKNLKIESKVRIYKSLIKPILQLKKQLLETATTKVLRKISKSLNQHITNEVRRQQCGIKYARNWIRQRRRK